MKAKINKGHLKKGQLLMETDSFIRNLHINFYRRNGKRIEKASLTICEIVDNYSFLHLFQDKMFGTKLKKKEELPF